MNNVTNFSKENSKKEILSFEEARQFLNVSKSYLYKLTGQKLIKHYKPTNGKIFFKKEDLMNWLCSNPVETIEEIGSRVKIHKLKNMKL